LNNPLQHYETDFYAPLITALQISECPSGQIPDLYIRSWKRRQSCFRFRPPKEYIQKRR